MSNINERLDKLKEKFCDENFLNCKGLGNEVSIYIFSYNPNEEMNVRYFIKSLDKETKFNAVRFDLYDILMNYLNERKVLDKVSALEERLGKDSVEKQIKNLVPPDLYINKMRYDNHKDGDILIVSGVGRVYPFVRIHTMLENLTTEFKDIPVVVFYPGKYDCKTLTLFNKFFDDNHYRSFSLIK